jgi:hypothetical protein
MSRAIAMRACTPRSHRIFRVEISVGQAGKIVEHLRNQLFASRIPRLGRLSEKQDQISRLYCSLGPSRRRSSEGVALEFVLAMSQGCLIGLNFLQAAANFRRFLSGHAATLVEFHGVVRHDRLPFLSHTIHFGRRQQEAMVVGG